MKFSLPKSRLFSYLQHVLQVVPTKSTLPILTNILIEALDNKIKISATDLDISITTSIDCTVVKKVLLQFPLVFFFILLKNCRNRNIVLKQQRQE